MFRQRSNNIDSGHGSLYPSVVRPAVGGVRLGRRRNARRNPIFRQSRAGVSAVQVRQQRFRRRHRQSVR